MRRRRVKLIALFGGCVLLVVAAAMASARPRAPTSPVSGATASQQPGQGVCFTAVFSGPLPGKADYCLGMRDWNKGHYHSGLEFLKLAAGWSNKDAQYTLGLIYYGGHHVAANPALGMAWLKLADERGNDARITQVRRSAFKSATAAQRQHAEQLFDQMKGTYGDKVAASRAWRRLRHWERLHGAFDSGCVRVFGAQAAAARRLGLAGEPPQSLRPMLRPSRPINTNDNAQKLHARFSNANAGVCITIQTQHHVARQLSEKYFSGWMGDVTVGPLHAVPAPASSSGH